MTVPGSSWVVRSGGDASGPRREIRGEGETFDELVVEGIIHCEQMSRNCWWLQLGGNDGPHLSIVVRKDGTAWVGVQEGRIVRRGARRVLGGKDRKR